MSNEAILDILKTVNYPGFSRDLVSFGLVQEAKLEDSTAKVVLELSTSDLTLPKSIQESAEKALLASSEIDRAEVTIRVKKQPDTSGNDSKRRAKT